MDPENSAVGDCYMHGCNCSEAVLHAFRDRLPFELSDETMRIATCFGGTGIAKSSLCGALSGAVMVISLLAGRDGPEGSREPACGYACEFGERFVTRFGDNTCKTLQIHEYGTPEQKSNCKKILVATDELLEEFLTEKNLLPAETPTNKY